MAPRYFNQAELLKKTSICRCLRVTTVIHKKKSLQMDQILSMFTFCKSVFYKSKLKNSTAIKISTILAHIFFYKLLRWYVLQNLFLFQKYIYRKIHGLPKRGFGHFWDDQKCVQISPSYRTSPLSHFNNKQTPQRAPVFCARIFRIYMKNKPKHAESAL